MYQDFNLKVERTSKENESPIANKKKIVLGIVGLVVFVCVVAIVFSDKSHANFARTHMQAERTAGDIVGGQAATANEFPFMVSLQRTDLNNRHWCGGTIIGAMDVLTAAHCCEGRTANDYRAVAGEHSTAAVSGLEQIRAVQSLTMHGSYGVGHMYNADVCIVRLKEPFRFNNVVKAATLAGQGAGAPAVGTAVTVIGWGDIVDGGVSSATLLKTSVNVVSDAECNRLYNLGGSSTRANMICASSAGRDSCQGDSGGPLFTADETVVGVVSWGSSCAHPNYPGVYAEVSFFRDWIDQNSLSFSIVEANGQRCSSACPGGTAVQTGSYWGASAFYMCAVNSNNGGYRGGWNKIQPEYGLDVKCGYATNGGEHNAAIYDCVCSPNYRMVDANSQTCPQACSSQNLNAVPTGIYDGDITQVMYACAANWSGAGYRGGWNAMVGSHSTHCAVAAGHNENYENPFRCVCV